MRHINYVDW